MAVSQAFTDALTLEVSRFNARQAAAVAVVQSQLDIANQTITSLKQSLTDADADAVQAITDATPPDPAAPPPPPPPPPPAPPADPSQQPS